MSFVEIERVSFAYGEGGEDAVVDRIDWTIDQGAFHCLVGRSGCGKTTLLKLAAGLLSPGMGTVRIQGQVVNEPSAQVGFVFQSPNLLDWLTVTENVLLPVSLHRRVVPADRGKAVELLDLVGLGTLADRMPGQLSGGQRSRVAIARALIDDPALLLMDEPFAALDAITREELQNDLLRLCATRNTTVLFVTHDIAEAIFLADRVAVMERGRVVETLGVPIVRPRAPELRFENQFNTLCRAVRRVMDGAP